MRQAAERLVAEKLRAQAEIHPGRLAAAVIEEFRQILQFEQHTEVLRAGLHAHIEKLIVHPTSVRALDSDAPAELPLVRAKRLRPEPMPRAAVPACEQPGSAESGKP
jgi:hypothetical protein